MTIEVDEAAIKDRVTQRRQQRRGGVDLWVELDGLDRPGNEVGAAAGSLPDGAQRWEVRPTTGGAYTWLFEDADWDMRVRELAEALEGRGHAGSVSVPWVDPWFGPSSEVPFPTALLVHRLDPPGDAGPFNAYGVPEPRWGMPEPATRHLLTEATDWVLLPGTGAHVGDVVRTPVTAQDAAEVVRPLLDKRLSNLSLASQPRDGGAMRRSVGFAPFGRTWWMDLDPDADPLALVEGLEQVVVRAADGLEHAAVHPAFPGTHESEATTTSVWRRHPHLWSSYVPDAFGVQLLTGRHLAHAHDLSGWQVSEVAEDRWLVRARDLAAWFRPPEPTALRQGLFPDPAVRAQAREDFGQMVLTQQSTRP